MIERAESSPGIPAYAFWGLLPEEARPLPNGSPQPDVFDANAIREVQQTFKDSDPAIYQRLGQLAERMEGEASIPSPVPVPRLHEPVLPDAVIESVQVAPPGRRGSSMRWGGSLASYLEGFGQPQTGRTGPSADFGAVSERAKSSQARKTGVLIRDSVLRVERSAELVTKAAREHDRAKLVEALQAVTSTLKELQESVAKLGGVASARDLEVVNDRFAGTQNNLRWVGHLAQGLFLDAKRYEEPDLQEAGAQLAAAAVEADKEVSGLILIVEAALFETRLAEIVKEVSRRSAKKRLRSGETLQFKMMQGALATNYGIRERLAQAVTEQLQRHGIAAVAKPDPYISQAEPSREPGVSIYPTQQR